MAMAPQPIFDILLVLEHQAQKGRLECFLCEHTIAVGELYLLQVIRMMGLVTATHMGCFHRHAGQCFNDSLDANPDHRRHYVN